MAQEGGGWPLGLQPVNLRVGLVRNHAFSGSISSNTFLTGSTSSSTDFSSDLDTESTGSFFHDKSITFGSLIGVSSILELSRRSLRGRSTESLRSKKNYKSKTWLFSLCSKSSSDTENVANPLSLGQFLEVERKSANNYRRNQSPRTYEPCEYGQGESVREANSLFVNGLVAPPRSSPLRNSVVGKRNNRSIGNGSVCGLPILLSCICGHASN